MNRRQRDSQRYYGNATGRFLTPDPYMATSGSANNPTDPNSWNRYAYVEGDPVNYNDPSGLFGLSLNQYDGFFGGGVGPGDLGPRAQELNYASNVQSAFLANQLNTLQQNGGVSQQTANFLSGVFPLAQVLATTLPSGSNGNFNGGSIPLVTSMISFGSIVDMNNLPALAGSVNVPVPYLPTLNISVPFAFLPAQGQACIGIGVAVGGPGINLGPLLWGSTSEVSQIVSGFGWSAVGQLAIGVQYLQSGQNAVGGPTVGSQGASIGYSYSRCFP